MSAKSHLCLLALLGSLSGAAPASAQTDMPKYDMEARCKDLSSDPSGTSAHFNKCVSIETKSRDWAVSDWNEASSARRSDCDAQERSRDFPSYLRLSHCLKR